MIEPIPGSGHLPEGAKKIFDEALSRARHYPPGSDIRSNIISVAHRKVRIEYPEFFKPDPLYP